MSIKHCLLTMLHYDPVSAGSGNFRARISLTRIIGQFVGGNFENKTMACQTFVGSSFAHVSFYFLSHFQILNWAAEQVI